MKISDSSRKKMESRLPKPSGLKRPGVFCKAILPTERLKANTCILKDSVISRFPLTRDLSNCVAMQSKRAASPEIARPNPIRSKLRRSRSAGDLREAFSRPLKRPEPTLAPIPAKSTKFAFTSNPSSASSMVSSIRTGLPARGAISSTSTATKKAITTTKTVAPKRIPPYDYKARFNDLMEKHKTLKEKYEKAREQLAMLDNLPEQYEESQNELFTRKQELNNCKIKIDCLEKQNNSQSIKIDALTKCLDKTKKELDKFTEKCEAMTKEQSSMTQELTELRIKCSELSNSVEILTKELEASKNQLFNSNIERKELHNTIMDLRGNIRVFCRVRPPLDFEEDRLLCGWNYLDESTLEILNLELLAGAKNKVGSHEFRFDHVFHSKSSQEDVFEMVSPLIQSALDGYNICIFAYGQTGSGKTYTMDGTSESVGVIPRTVDLLFESITNYKRLGWEYEIKATFLEIYNEVLYDLLSNEQKDMEIRMCKNKSDIYVSNITEEVVVNANRLRHLMQVAKMNRATASTASNERSSRSHAVTRIELIGSHEDKSEISIGTINLVDLAGSESPKTSIRMNETKNINRSLSELTNVILALLQKQDHIPYRNSKLTHLLMPSLGGNSKTLMFINVAPFQDCYVESVKSLRFAASVNSCKMTKARKNKFLNTSNLI